MKKGQKQISYTFIYLLTLQKPVHLHNRCFPPGVLGRVVSYKAFPVFDIFRISY